MFTELLLAITIVTGSAAVPDQVPVSPDRMIECPTPSAITGPVRARHRKPGGLSQVASTAVRQEVVYRLADGSAQPEQP